MLAEIKKNYEELIIALNTSMLVKNKFIKLKLPGKEIVLVGVSCLTAEKRPVRFLI